MNKRTILVVDDNEMCRNVLAKVLLKCNYEVITAPSGEEAIEVFKKEECDLFIADIKMPGISGIDLLKILRTVAPQIGVIIITGYGEIDSYLESMALGASGYLQKPIEADKLRQAVANYFSKLEGHKLISREQSGEPSHELRRGI